jgi:hypothetical protein
MTGFQSLPFDYVQRCSYLFFASWAHLLWHMEPDVQICLKRSPGALDEFQFFRLIGHPLADLDVLLDSIVESGNAINALLKKGDEIAQRLFQIGRGPVAVDVFLERRRGERLLAKEKNRDGGTQREREHSTRDDWQQKPKVAQLVGHDWSRYAIQLTGCQHKISPLPGTAASPR